MSNTTKSVMSEVKEAARKQALARQWWDSRSASDKHTDYPGRCWTTDCFGALTGRERDRITDDLDAAGLLEADADDDRYAAADDEFTGSFEEGE